MPADRRAAMCRTALETADRDADKRLVLEVLLRYPSDEMQAIALEAAKVPALKDEAMLVVMGMASKGINRAELGKALAQAGQQPVKLEIIKAEYGAGEQDQGRHRDPPPIRQELSHHLPAQRQLQREFRWRSGCGNREAAEDQIPDRRQGRRGLAERERHGRAADAEIERMRSKGPCRRSQRWCDLPLSRYAGGLGAASLVDDFGRGLQHIGRDG